MTLRKRSLQWMSSKQELNYVFIAHCIHSQADCWMGGSGVLLDGRDLWVITGELGSLPVYQTKTVKNVFHCMHAQADCWRGLRDAPGWQGFMSGYWRTGATPHWVLAVNPAAYPSKVPDLGVISQGAHPLVTLPPPLCKHVCTVAYL